MNMAAGMHFIMVIDYTFMNSTANIKSELK